MIFVGISLGCVLLIALIGHMVDRFWIWQSRPWKWKVDFYGKMVWNPKCQTRFFNTIPSPDPKEVPGWVHYCGSEQICNLEFLKQGWRPVGGYGIPSHLLEIRSRLRI